MSGAEHVLGGGLYDAFTTIVGLVALGIALLIAYWVTPR